MSFVCPQANTNPSAPTAFCEAKPGRCTQPADPGTYGPLRGTSTTCDGLVCTLHGCQRADGHSLRLARVGS
jgi:hypothetical protein